MLRGQGRALAAEAFGTFMFVVIGAGAIVTSAANNGDPSLIGIALAHGLALAIAVSAWGGISGGHFNPAVTFGLALIGKHPWNRVPTYWVAQLVGALGAGYLLMYVYGSYAAAAASKTHLGTPALGAGVTPLVGIVLEAALTMFLLWAVCLTAVSPTAPRIAGFGIGLTVAVDILMGGPITGAAMNPARWFGPAVAAGFYSDWYVYWVGPLAGAAIGALTYKWAFEAKS